METAQWKEIDTEQFPSRSPLCHESRVDARAIFISAQTLSPDS